MAARKIRKKLAFIEYLNNASDEERMYEIKSMTPENLRFFVNLLYNIVYKKVAISEDARNQLKGHQKEITNIIKKNKSMKTRRQDFLAGSTFKNIFSILIPDLQKAAL